MVLNNTDKEKLSEKINNFFKSDGVLANFLGSYEKRDEQIELSNFINNAMENGDIALCEAGTGIGKTFAYLIPAIKKSILEEERVIIATSTITLQKQLIDKDLKTIFTSLKLPNSNYCIFMGRNNYLCRKKIDNYFKNLDELNGFKLQTHLDDKNRNDFIRWYSTNKTLLISDLNEELTDYSFKTGLSNMVCSKEGCEKSKCPFYSSCGYYCAKNRANKAKLIVTNHHTLLSDIKIRNDNNEDFNSFAILPDYDTVIIDEAHNLANNARNFFDTSYISFNDYGKLFSIKSTKKSDNFLKTLINTHPSEDDLKNDFDNLEFSLKTTIENFNSKILDKLSSTLTENNLNGEIEYNHIFFNNINETDTIPLLLKKGIELIKKLIRDSNKENNKNEYEQAQELIKKIEEYKDDFLNLTKNYDEKKVYWSRFRSKKDNKPYFSLNATFINIGDVLYNSFFSKMPCVILTSATIDANDNFTFFKSSIGLKESNRTKSILLNSPFDYDSNLLALIPNDIDKINNNNQKLYIENILEPIVEAIRANQGGTLILCTSNKFTEELYYKLKPKVNDLGLNIKGQIEGESKTNLLKNLKEKKINVLVASLSFWEGIDIPGNALSLTIITKLPFDYFKTPIEEAIQKQYRTPFTEYAVPKATIKLKQGIGRLIRNKTDRGIILILDSRINKTQYGIKMLEALPFNKTKVLPASRIYQEIKNFY